LFKTCAFEQGLFRSRLIINQVIDEDFDKWKKGKLIKQCPSCQYWTEKNEGCNHMTCKGCGYMWCWLCEGRYEEDHYRRGGSCYGMQFGDNRSLHNPFLRKLFVFGRICLDVLIVFLIVLLFLLFGVFFGSIALFNRINRRLLRNQPKLFMVYIYFILFLNSMIFQIPLTCLVFSLVSVGVSLSLVLLPCLVLIIYKLKNSNFI
jgi:hypothetical protein